MEVGLHGVAYRQAPLLGEGAVAARIPRRIHDQGPPVAQLDQVGGVPEALIDDGHDG
jgi:hypothetical protein